jgi:hypothetical protein
MSLVPLFNWRLKMTHHGAAGKTYHVSFYAFLNSSHHGVAFSILFVGVKNWQGSTGIPM